MRAIDRRSAVVLGCALAATAAVAFAAPQVTIHARTELRLRSVRIQPDGTMVVAGELVDRGSGTGVGGHQVVIGLDHASTTEFTRPDGTFQATFPAQAGAPTPVDVGLSFGGDASFDASHVEEQGVDPTKAPVDLVITAVATPEGALVTVDATADNARIEVPVTVRVSADDAAEPHKDLDVTTGHAAMLRRTDAFGPGVKRLHARFTGDVGRAAATADTTVELATGTRVVDLSLSSSSVSFEGTVHARGKVVDDDGLPVPRATVALFSDTHRLGAATTGKDGKWKIDVAADLLGVGRHPLTAKVETRETWRRPSPSTPPVFVTIGAPSPAPVGLTLAAFVATAVLAVGFVLARRRPWHKAEPPLPTPAAAPEPRGGLEPGRASLVSTLRRASDHGFAGTVRDAVRLRPLGGAEVLLTSGATVRRATSDDDGRFAIEELAAAEWSARVAVAGHVTEQFVVSIPHRGELRGARIDLVPVREKVFALYRRAALPLLPSPDLWGIWSPRQIVDHVRAARPPTALADLTGFVEEAYFSARTPEESILPTAETKVAAALAERAA